MIEKIDFELSILRHLIAKLNAQDNELDELDYQSHANIDYTFKFLEKEIKEKELSKLTNKEKD